MARLVVAFAIVMFACKSEREAARDFDRRLVATTARVGAGSDAGARAIDTPAGIDAGVDLRRMLDELQPVGAGPPPLSSIGGAVVRIEQRALARNGLCDRKGILW